MTMRMAGRGTEFDTTVNVNAPSTTKFDGVKNKFHEDLHAFLVAVPKEVKLVVPGDLMDSIDIGHTAWEEVLWRHGIRESNSNGLCLLKDCAKRNITPTSAFFRLPMREKAT
ncbi:hypothetical protein SprV_0602122400 [Sparganum proliferum]